MTFIISLETMAYEVSSQEETLRKGPWFEEEDETLTAAVALLGARRWDALAKASGLRRSGKSCRLRWLNYLHPNLKHGEITAEEELVIMQLHKLWGNKWAKIARRLPGRTDNEVKNYWRSHLSKKLIHAKEQEDFGANVINDEKQNSLVPISDGRPTNSYLGHCTYEMDDILRTSVDPSCAFNELSNIDFGSSPCNARVSDMISSCWSYEQSEVKHHDSHSRECLGLYACFCYPCWSYEKKKAQPYGIVQVPFGDNGSLYPSLELTRKFP